MKTTDAQSRTGDFEMSQTYRAVQVSAPGQLELTERTVREPGTGEVRIRVEACGVCHSDSVTVNVVVPSVTLPRVPGHEVVGRIDAIGSDVHDRALGDRVVSAGSAALTAPANNVAGGTSSTA